MVLMKQGCPHIVNLSVFCKTVSLYHWDGEVIQSQQSLRGEKAELGVGNLRVPHPLHETLNRSSSLRSTQEL